MSPEPPRPLPPGRVVHLPGRGETFVREAGPAGGPPVLLLHGWMVSADINWFAAYDTLADAGMRVIALDHRGHGRGIRAPERFRLEDCAADAAALLRALDAGPATVVGYSMGGPIAQLLARAAPDLVRGLVLCATAAEWREPRMRVLWNGMAALRLVLGLAPERAWSAGLRRIGFRPSPTTDWVAAELTRGSARDVAEAGRELGRFDSRSWLGELGMPAAVLVTTKDTAVLPRKQRALAEALRAPAFDVRGDHGAVVGRPRELCEQLLAAIAAVRDGGAAR